MGNEQLSALVARELALVEDPARREALRRLLVPPRIEAREWDYGTVGERFEYWVVAEKPDQGVLLVYCEKGFGPAFPSGFLFTDESDSSSLGMDSQWNWYLEEAFVRSGLWTGPTKPGFEEPFHLSPEERFGPNREGRRPIE